MHWQQISEKQKTTVNMAPTMMPVITALLRPWIIGLGPRIILKQNRYSSEINVES
jgi:hypothetical protein